MKLSFVLSLTSLAVIASSSPLDRRASQPTVYDPSSQITYLGSSADGVETFSNIRYGQDTSGSNRFRAPQPFLYSNNTVVNASSAGGSGTVGAMGAACPQPMVPYAGVPIFSNVTNISEDCLTLRIDRSANTTADAKLPVMVWIYGGGFAIGQIYDQAYIPTYFVSAAAGKKTPFIYVAMNYRLGIFGFASSPAISPDDANMGLLDQRLALQWVNKNIHLFGGDPNNVTLFGESAGAYSVGMHLVSYAGNETMRPPIQRAIEQSGGSTAERGITSNTTANHTSAVIGLTNCTSSSNNHSAELDCLRALPLDQLLSIATNYSAKLSPPSGFNVFNPVVPSTILPAAPSVLLANGSFHKNISLISGWTENDGSIFVPTTIRTEDDLVTWLSTTGNLTASAINQTLSLYPSSSFQGNTTENITVDWFRASQIERDRGAVCPSLKDTAAMANYSANGTATYLYALNETLFTPFLVNRSYIGVPHFSDIGFVFNMAAVPQYHASSDKIILANRMSGSWAAFGNNGNPAGSSFINALNPWTAGATANVSTEFGVRILGGPRDGMATIGGIGNSTVPAYGEDIISRCQFWNSMEILQMTGT